MSVLRCWAAAASIVGICLLAVPAEAAHRVRYRAVRHSLPIPHHQRWLVPVVRDRDGDGMPDYWERRYNLNPRSAADGPQDTDGDGLTNQQEFQRHLDPI